MKESFYRYRIAIPIKILQEIKTVCNIGGYDTSLSRESFYKDINEEREVQFTIESDYELDSDDICTKVGHLIKNLEE